MPEYRYKHYTLKIYIPLKKLIDLWKTLEKGTVYHLQYMYFQILALVLFIWLWFEFIVNIFMFFYNLFLTFIVSLKVLELMDTSHVDTNISAVLST